MTDNIQWHMGNVTYKDRCKLLGQKGCVVWLTGLSGSGKSTIAVELEKKLFSMGKASYRLDGDNIRHGLNTDLAFSEKDRNENIRRIAEVAALFKDAGFITLAACISPLRSQRALAREKIGDHFFEIFLKADIATCSARDPKGLYKKARAGEIGDFTGVSAPYEEPDNADLTLDTTNDPINTCVGELLALLEHKKII